ncbi:ABC transporter ATP-binding protein [Sedimentibacter hydroxybenzoicus DSM 7310]|uniref:ABC transporter ATP-binding protein n=1 Tax=Sedimentibacter hydroxybenzoicus DSM 7310 TaxID=1123245 RepID=A0A974BHX3_SEDHY|nr:ABC transporter ATP-binding protein [Sedimentibacter hydroxybenzoicus]NYB73181.1 ABC transporter ATP-binding protein [Sedimentibacter hydroxybenzoicus DSM 7310]
MENNSKKYDKNLYKRLLRYAKPYLLYFISAIAIILVIVVLELYQPVLLGDAVDTFLSQYGSKGNPVLLDRTQDIEGVVKIGGIYLLTVIIIFFLNYAQALILSFAGQKIIYNIRMEVFANLSKLSLSFFTKSPIGKLVTRVTNDTEALNEMYTSVIVNVLKSCFVLVGIIITMISYNLRLSLYTFTVIPFIMLFTFIFQNVSMKIHRNIRSKISGLNAFVSEHVSGMKIVQIFAVENEVLDKFKNENEKLRNEHMKQLFTFSIYTPTNFLMNITATSILIWFGGKMVLEGIISIGTIVVFQRYISKFFEPIQELAEQLNIIQSAAAASERIFDLLDEDQEIKESENPVEMDEFRGSIEFKNVWFSYKEDEWILKDVSFKVNPGESIAFVGATGAGKTTIQSLICRYYDIQKGEILIDGINIRDIRISDLRKNIGQMLQDVFLFSGDIKSNIRLKNENITDEEIFEASKYVNADNFISRLKNKYDEHVIENGTAFSSGQRQLISFARTLAFKPDILILDEATANIDTETEVLIQDALRKIMKNRTTLIVAHRLSTIQNSDKIIVMHKGEVREEGTHQELLAERGIYYKLYKLQYEERGHTSL